MDLEKSRASLFSAGPRSTFPQREKPCFQDCTVNKQQDQNLGAGLSGFKGHVDLFSFPFKNHGGGGIVVNGL